MPGGLELTFTAPNRAISENELGRTWQKKYRMLKPWKEAIAAAWDDADQELVRGKPCTVRVAIPFSVNRTRDPHNYVGTICKALVDALVKRGAWEDDNPEWISVDEPTIEIRKDGQVTVRLVPRVESHT